MKFRDRAALAYRILTHRKVGNLEAHAEKELLLALPPDGDMNDMMREGILEMVLVFSTQGHSGMSAGFAIDTLGRVLKYEPLTPLTGKADEWTDVGGGYFQNKRDSRVFKDRDTFGGAPYTLDAYIFEEPSGATFTGIGSQKRIEFPYTRQPPVYVKVDGTGRPIEEQYRFLRADVFPRDMKGSTDGN